MIRGLDMADNKKMKNYNKKERGRRAGSAAVIILSLIAALWSLVHIVTVTVMILKEPASISGFAGQMLLLLTFLAFILPVGVIFFITLPLNLLWTHTFGRAWNCGALITSILVPAGWAMISLGCFDNQLAAAIAIVVGAALPNIMTIFTVFELDRFRHRR